MRRVLHKIQYPETPQPPEEKPSEPRRKRELSEAEKEQVKRRDNYTCLCCGATGRGIRLQIDHIVPYNLGGETTVENSQTLCSVCNREKKLNELNFQQTATLLPGPCELDLLERAGREEVRQSITRLVNYFYRCRAVSHVGMHRRASGTFYSTWMIELFTGNDPTWLSQHKRALLAHVQEEFGCEHVTDVQIVGPKIAQQVSREQSGPPLIGPDRAPKPAVQTRPEDEPAGRVTGQGDGPRSGPRVWYHGTFPKDLAAANPLRVYLPSLRQLTPGDWYIMVYSDGRRRFATAPRLVERVRLVRGDWEVAFAKGSRGVGDRPADDLEALVPPDAPAVKYRWLKLSDRIPAARIFEFFGLPAR
jgi:hypothetical protein